MYRNSKAFLPGLLEIPGRNSWGESRRIGHDNPRAYIPQLATTPGGKPSPTTRAGIKLSPSIESTIHDPDSNTLTKLTTPFRHTSAKHKRRLRPDVPMEPDHFSGGETGVAKRYRRLSIITQRGWCEAYFLSRERWRSTHAAARRAAMVKNERRERERRHVIRGWGRRFDNRSATLSAECAQPVAVSCRLTCAKAF